MLRRTHTYVRSAIVLCSFCAAWATIVGRVNWHFNNGPEVKGQPGSLGYSRRRGFRGFVLVTLWLLLATITYQHFGLVFPAIKLQVVNGARREWNKITLGWCFLFGAAIVVRLTIHMICYAGYSPAIMQPFTTRDGDFALESSSLACVLVVFIVMGFYVVHTQAKRTSAVRGHSGPQLESSSSPHGRQRWVILFFFELGIAFWSAQSPMTGILSNIAVALLGACVLAILVYSTLWLGRLENRELLGTINDSYDLAVLMYFGILLMRIVSRFTNVLSSANLGSGPLSVLVELLSPFVFGSVMVLMTLLMDFVAPIVFPRRPAKWMTFVARFAQELFTSGAAYASFQSIDAIVIYCAWSMMSVSAFDSGFAHDLWTMMRGVHKTVVRFQRQKMSESGSSLTFGANSSSPLDTSRVSGDLMGVLGPAVRAAGDSSDTDDTSLLNKRDYKSSCKSGSLSESPRQTRKLSIPRPKSPSSFRTRLGTAAIALLKVRPVIPDQALLYAQQIERAQFSLLARLCCISCFVAIVLIDPEKHFYPNASVTPPWIVLCTSIASLLPWPLVVVWVLRNKAKRATELARKETQARSLASMSGNGNGGAMGSSLLLSAVVVPMQSIGQQQQQSNDVAATPHAGLKALDKDRQTPVLESRAEAACPQDVQPVSPMAHGIGIFTMCRIDLWDSGAVTFIFSMVSMLVLCKFGPLDM